MKLKEIFNSIKQSIKIFLVAALLNFIGYSYINNFLIPDEKIALTQLSIIDNKVSENYDIEIKNYKDLKYVQSLQKEAIAIQYDLQKTKMFRVFTVSLMLITMVGILAWWLQYIYTDMKFKENGKISYNILSIALLSSAIIIGLVYYVTMLS